MKLNGIISSAILCLSIGIAVPTYAQQEQHEDQKDKPAQQDEKRGPDDKSAKPEHRAEQQPDKNAKQEEKKTQEHDKNASREQPNTQEQQNRAHQGNTEQPEQRANNNGRGRIPEDRFRTNFGREHLFVIRRPVIVEGAPRFQYGGYWFAFGAPWPVAWSYSDNVYVDYIDGGYYLYNPVHPGIRILVNVM